MWDRYKGLLTDSRVEGVEQRFRVGEASLIIVTELGLIKSQGHLACKFGAG